MAEKAPSSPRALLIKIGVVLLVFVVVGVLIVRGYDVKGGIQRLLEYVRSAGPVAYFVAQALLPAFGFPQAAFSLTAGSLFGPQLGMGWVVCFVLLALAANMALSYWMAGYLLRPLLEKIVRRLGYQLPEVDANNATDLIVLLRVAPGVPFFAQNYLLGLSRVPFGKYLLFSCLIAGPINAAFVLFGDALLQGKGRIALIAFSVITALVVATQMIRKHYAKKRA